ncbi:MAG: TRAP transporter substrate-binding protein [Betaproteobacteria bacterium]|nr:MAG: TRAP transporter substrate-binding protein [Betaproteobacteria bacterium]
MRRFVEESAAALCIAALLFASGCGNGDNQQQASVSGDATAPTTEKVTLQMTSVFPSSLELLGDSALKFAENVKRVSGGTLEIRVFEPGALVPGLEAIPAVSKGSVQTAWSSPGFFAGTDMAFSFFSTVPFGANAPEFLAWLYYGGGLELSDEMFGEHNVKAIPCSMIPPEASGWFRQEIKSLDDLRGIKMRFFGLGARVMDKLGVSTQLLAPGDIFQSLQLGTIDATEFSMPSSDESFGFYQVAKYYYFPGWHQPSSLGDVFINMDVWNGLSDHHKAVIEITCGDMIRDMLARGEATQAPAMRRMRDQHGVNIMYWPPEFLEAYEKAWNEVVEEESKNNANFRKVYASFSKFREEFKLWGDNGYLKR